MRCRVAHLSHFIFEIIRRFEVAKEVSFLALFGLFVKVIINVVTCLCVSLRHLAGEFGKGSGWQFDGDLRRSAAFHQILRVQLASYDIFRVE
jgi:hypothetical protein